MQHWVLCEILAAARNVAGDQARLHYIDANSMAPLSHVEDGSQSTRRQFDNACRNLPGQHSRYEDAWHQLALPVGSPYPSSAVFVADAWKGPLSMCLCEINVAIANEIKTWLGLPQNQQFGPNSQVLERTWRSGFEWTTADLFLIQFDPYFYDPNPKNCLSDQARMYPQDLELLGRWLDEKSAPVVVQISSYSSMRVCGSDPAADVDASSTRLMNELGFRRECAVVAQGDMISLVFSRGLKRDLGLDDADQRFRRWLRGIPAT